MAKLICTALTSLDGYHSDEHGEFEWSAPDSEVLAFLNELERPVKTYLYGRRLYDLMAYWESAEPDEPGPERDFAEIWRALSHASTARTRIEREFDPDAVRAMKDTADSDLSIGGPELASHAFRAGLVDEIRLFLSPLVVGGGTRLLPDHLHVGLDLQDERRFANGVVYVSYRVSG
jgi:dihydrofolate reductase